jgi:hypothetical protein
MMRVRSIRMGTPAEDPEELGHPVTFSDCSRVTGHRKEPHYFLFARPTIQNGRIRNTEAISSNRLT